MAELEGIVEGVSDERYDIDMDLYSEFAWKPETMKTLKGTCTIITEMPYVSMWNSPSLIKNMPSFSRSSQN